MNMSVQVTAWIVGKDRPKMSPWREPTVGIGRRMPTGCLSSFAKAWFFKGMAFGNPSVATAPETLFDALQTTCSLTYDRANHAKRRAP